MSDLEIRELSPDYGLLQRLLECHTCKFCNIALLYRAPNCLNKDRENFGISGHDAQLHGKCPAHEPMDSTLLAETKRVHLDAYMFGELCLKAEMEKRKDQKAEIDELHKHLNVGLL